MNGYKVGAWSQRCWRLRYQNFPSEPPLNRLRVAERGAISLLRVDWVLDQRPSQQVLWAKGNHLHLLRCFFRDWDLDGGRRYVSLAGLTRLTELLTLEI